MRRVRRFRRVALVAFVASRSSGCRVVASSRCRVSLLDRFADGATPLSARIRRRWQFFPRSNDESMAWTCRSELCENGLNQALARDVAAHRPVSTRLGICRLIQASPSVRPGDTWSDPASRSRQLARLRSMRSTRAPSQSFALCRPELISKSGMRAVLARNIARFECARQSRARLALRRRRLRRRMPCRVTINQIPVPKSRISKRALEGVQGEGHAAEVVGLVVV